MRSAVIDLCSNSFHLLVADVDPALSLREGMLIDVARQHGTKVRRAEPLLAV